MNLLNKTLCYLGGCLENKSDTPSWRDELTKELSKLGVVCLDPTKQIFQGQDEETEEDRNNLKKWRENGEFNRVHEFMRDVIRRDLRAIDMTSFTVFRIEPNTPSWGTPHEISLASIQRKAILILIDDKYKMPLWLMGLINMDFVFESIEELVDYLYRVDSGNERVDPKYWKILAKQNKP